MRFLVFLSICAIIVTALTGCGGGGGSSSSHLQLFITDAPIDAEAINVKLTSIEVHSDAGGWVTVKQFADTDPAINLLDYQAKNDFDNDPATVANLLLLDAPLTPGHYTMVRLHVSSVEVVKGGQTYPVDMNNLDQTGIKLNHEFDVAQGQACALLLDFNGKQSIIELGNGSYKMQPVIAMVPKNVIGSISGTVVFHDATAAVVPVADGPVTVEAYTAGTSTLVNSADVTMDVARTGGSFTVGALLPGTYDIKIVAPGYAADTVRLAGVVVGPAEDKNVGEIVVSPP
jgi:hypothetical protein